MGDECSHDVCVDRLMVCCLASWSCQVFVDSGNVSGQLLVLLLIGLIEEQEDEVETRE